VQKTETLLSGTWPLFLIIGSCVVLSIAVLVLVRSIIRGGGVFASLRKALGVIFRNLP
jgi:hypothetical protein